ncbi:ATP-binding protein [Alcaligenaceae bacterium A4P071]|nr:ATP-binding protein [Alcaligenaceae bacterium A4P071]
MEVIRGWTHTAFPIEDESRIGEARRFAARAVESWQWSADDAGRLALVITELGTNLLRHAVNGRLFIAARADVAEVEILSIDEGPGMDDLPTCMTDGHSSGSTAGIGMGAVKRLSNEFDIHTATPAGTVIVARVRAGRETGLSATAPVMRLGAVCLPAPGEIECGDAWAAGWDDARIALTIVDGLGHGPEAAKASSAAVDIFAAAPGASIQDIVQRTHIGLQATRGAALCVAAVDIAARKLTYVGAGNIVGRVVSGVFDKSLVTQHGTAGAQIRKPESADVDIPEHALVIFHSDGLAARWKPETIQPLLRRDPSIIAAVLLRDHSRLRDDATVVVLRLNA